MSKREKRNRKLQSAVASKKQSESMEMQSEILEMKSGNHVPKNNTSAGNLEMVNDVAGNRKKKAGKQYQHHEGEMKIAKNTRRIGKNGLKIQSDEDSTCSDEDSSENESVTLGDDDTLVIDDSEEVSGKELDQKILQEAENAAAQKVLDKMSEREKAALTRWIAGQTSGASLACNKSSIAATTRLPNRRSTVDKQGVENPAAARLPDAESSGFASNQGGSDQQHRVKNAETKTPWKDLFTNNRRIGNGLKLTTYETTGNRVVVSDEDVDELQTIQPIWGYALVGYIAGKNPGKGAIIACCNSWKVKYRTYFDSSGWIVIKFDKEEDRQKVLENGPYMIFGRPFIIKIMPRFFSYDEEEISKVPIWVRLPHLPVELWTERALSRIASTIGTPIQSDNCTQTRQRDRFARILVEVDVAKEMKKELIIELPNKREVNQIVEYEYVPRFCGTCKSIGHAGEHCEKNKVKEKGQNIVEVEPSNIEKEKGQKIVETHYTTKVTKKNQEKGGEIVEKQNGKGDMGGPIGASIAKTILGKEYGLAHEKEAAGTSGKSNKGKSKSVAHTSDTEAEPNEIETAGTSGKEMNEPDDPTVEELWKAVKSKKKEKGRKPPSTR